MSCRSISLGAILRNDDLMVVNEPDEFYFLYDQSFNSARYVDIVRNKVHTIYSAETVNCWYQLHGAPGHCNFEIDSELTEIFQDRRIRPVGSWAWQARSPGLSPLSF